MKSGCESREAPHQALIQRKGAKSSAIQKSGIRKSKTSRWRRQRLILLNLLMVAHVIQWWIMGRTISPIEPSETMHTLQRGAINAGFIFFSLAILATLIFGRFVCGWGCHILALQDFCAWMLKENWPHSEAVSIQAPDLCPAYRRALYVCLAHGVSAFFQSQRPDRSSRNSPTILSPVIFGKLFLRSRSPFLSFSSADF